MIQMTEDRGQRSEDRRQKTEIRSQKKNNLFLSSVICLLFSVFCLLSLIGCDAFVRKFTRKPKKENLSKEAMVLTPMEYKAPQMAAQDSYRQYFLYWRSWHDELIESLSKDTNHKKQIEALEQTIKNLEELKELLKEEGKKKITIFIKQLKGLKNFIEKDPYGNNAFSNRDTAERIKRRILQDFSFNKIKDSLI